MSLADYNHCIVQSMITGIRRTTGIMHAHPYLCHDTDVSPRSWEKTEVYTPVGNCCSARALVQTCINVSQHKFVKTYMAIDICDRSEWLCTCTWYHTRIMLTNHWLVSWSLTDTS